MNAFEGRAAPPGKRQVKRGSVDVEKRGHVLPALSGVDLLAGFGYLLRLQFQVAPEFHGISCFGFAPDICNTSSPMFTGLPRMVQNLPFLKHDGAEWTERRIIGSGITSSLPTTQELVEK